MEKINDIVKQSNATKVINTLLTKSKMWQSYKVNLMSDEKKQNMALEDYKSTVELIVYEGTLYWGRFNVLFAVNAAILVFLGVIFGNQLTISQNTLIILMPAICFIGFVSSLTMLFMCSRSQMFYKSWFEHIEKLEKGTLKGYFSLMEDLHSYSKKHRFYPQIPIVTASFAVPLSFSGLFIIIPVLVNWQTACYYLPLIIIVIVILLSVNFYYFKKKS